MHRGNFPLPNVDFLPQKKKRTPVTKNVTYREKKTLVLMNKLAFFNDQPHHTFISS